MGGSQIIMERRGAEQISSYKTEFLAVAQVDSRTQGMWSQLIIPDLPFQGISTGTFGCCTGQTPL